MKIVHISASDEGGAGLCAVRICRSLRNLGIDSKLLVAHKSSGEDFVTEVLPTPINCFIPPKNKFLCRIAKFLHKRGFFKTELEKDIDTIKSLYRIHNAFFTLPMSCYDLSNHPLVQSADIVHLHWIESFVDYRTFFKAINKPIVWTFHDENIGLGGFHYLCEKNKFYSFYKDIEDKCYQIKKDAFRLSTNIVMVSLSEEMDNFCHTSSIMSKHPSSVIPNSVDYTKFSCIDKYVARQILHLDNDDLVFSFCAYDLGEQRKGLSVLLEAVSSFGDKNVTIICIGQGQISSQSDKVRIYHAGYVNNSDFQSVLYSASDFFVMPSLQEAFAQTPIEAMSCGVPVITFPVSGTAMLINDENGIRCKGFNLFDLQEGFKLALTRKYDRQQIRDDMIHRFSPTVIANQYIKLYNEVVNNHH